FYINDELKDINQVLDDVGGRLAAIRNLPDGAGPIHYERDFGDTATLMLTVASPKADAAEIDLRAREIRDVSAGIPPNTDRASLLLCLPRRENYRLTRLGATKFIEYLKSQDSNLDPKLLDGAGCVGADMRGGHTDEQMLGWL